MSATKGHGSTLVFECT
ncbi:hypothetical protein WJX79_000953 [Trebouxia sp. C0005]